MQMRNESPSLLINGRCHVLLSTVVITRMLSSGMNQMDVPLVPLTCQTEIKHDKKLAVVDWKHLTRFR